MAGGTGYLLNLYVLHIHGGFSIMTSTHWREGEKCESDYCRHHDNVMRIWKATSIPAPSIYLCCILLTTRYCRLVFYFRCSKFPSIITKQQKAIIIVFKSIYRWVLQMPALLFELCLLHLHQKLYTSSMFSSSIESVHGLFKLTRRSLIFTISTFSLTCLEYS